MLSKDGRMADAIVAASTEPASTGSKIRCGTLPPPCGDEWGCAVMAFVEAGDHGHLQRSIIPWLGLISVSGCKILWYPA